jgi:type 2 lantibiotic biosynthesis protein LanM
MSPSSSSQDVVWYRASTLSERIELRREEADPMLPKPSEAAARWSRRWRAQVPFNREIHFSQRLEALGIGNDEFLAALEEPATFMSGRAFCTPVWFQQLSRAYSDRFLDADLPLEDKIDPMFGLLNVAKPLMALGFSQLRQRIDTTLQKHRRPPLQAEIVEKIFLRALSRQLLAILSRVMVLELNIARLQGSLDGETREDRYRSFVKRLDERETALAMMLEYPVLAKQLVARVDQWFGVMTEFVERLCSDWGLIVEALGPKEADPGLLTDLQVDAGDRHRGGRCVLIATFSSGFKLVYKPKSMAVDAHFQELLNWINERGNHPKLRTLKIMDRGSYGWSEFVSVQACRSLPQLQRFYERQGAYLALLYVLEATDFHSENVIAAGEDPVLIDLEAIFHPRLKGLKQSEDSDRAALSHSVLRVGLLPWQSYTNEQSDSIDLSGLGGAAGQLTPHKIPYWEMVGTDEMKLSRIQMPIRASENRPSFNELEVAPSDYIQEIAAGFTSIYHLLMQHKDDLVASGGPLLRFAHDEVRMIFRPTRTYGVLLTESFHPDVMRDAPGRDLLFDRLWMAVEASPHLAKVITAECEDLQRGDIPYFRTRPDSLQVWSSTNRCISDLFERSSLSLVEERLHGLNENDLNLQRWLIRAALATSIVGHSRVEEHSSKSAGSSQVPVDRSRLLSAARTVGDRLESSAIRWNDGASWVGLTVADQGQWSITTTMLDLYDGLPGIALFLAYLGRSTGESRYSDLARESCNTMLRRLEEYKSAAVCIGGFAGWGGIIYALSQLGSLWHDSSLLRSAEEIVPLLAGQIASDEYFDVIAGSAGCIGSLLTLYQERRSPEILAAAKACGTHLIAGAKPTPLGVGWIIPKQTVPLSGFAHGAAGIAWALFRLAELTGEKRFKETADAAIAYERTLFDHHTANWRDLRTWGSSSNETDNSSMSAWCHGATGIGLARLAIAEYGDGGDVRREIDAALRTTINAGCGSNHSLCHGDGGTIELFLHASRALQDERWNLEAQRIANGIVESICRNEFRCGTPLKVDSPGLMTGLAGIGYGLLRLAEPDRVPSVLTLQPAPAQPGDYR